jgi:hypothetical protein
VRSPEYEKQVRSAVEQAYMHPDHHLHLALIRNKNRVADTVFQGGEDFNNPPSSPDRLSVSEQNERVREIKRALEMPLDNDWLTGFEDLFSE